MYPVPAVSDLAAFSGRPVATYTAYASQALLIATLVWTIRSEITDPTQLATDDDRLLAQQGILALADDTYLKQPYQAVMASPLNNETIGSYSYSKNAYGGGGTMSRMAPAALELKMEQTGVMLFDLALQYLARRTRTGGVFSESIGLFEEGPRDERVGAGMFIEDGTGRRWILGPDDRDFLPLGMPFMISGETPMSGDPTH
jgi:hypothetical protein